MNYQTNGRIVQGVGGLYTIRLDQSENTPTPLDGLTITCRARGVFRHEGTTPLPGDRVTVGYDDTALEAMEMNFGDVFNYGNSFESENVTDNPFFIGYANGKTKVNLTGNGVVFSMTFRVKDAAATGKYVIDLETGNPYDNYDVDYNDVVFDYEQ